MTRLLIHSEALPLNIRAALAAATLAPAEQRPARLASVARLLHVQTSLDCRDARELVGLDSNGSC